MGAHDCGYVYIYIWAEDVGKRESDKVGSVLITFLEG
jgi:hypothetical protein